MSSYKRRKRKSLVSCEKKGFFYGRSCLLRRRKISFVGKILCEEEERCLNGKEKSSYKWPRCLAKIAKFLFLENMSCQKEKALNNEQMSCYQRNFFRFEKMSCKKK